MLKWQKGRQDGGYEKITFIESGFRLSKMLGFDIHLLRYQSGSFIPEHVDQVKEGNHHRFNLIIKKPKSGGVFRCDKCVSIWRLTYFRPDLYKHSVSECVGSRYVLSFGVVLK
jgi:hypothetical protein